MKTIINIDKNKVDYQGGGTIDGILGQLLLKSPKIIYVQKFDDETYDKFRKEIECAHNTGQEIIPIIINSFGGQVYNCLGMMDIIKNSDLPVATILQAKAMSCGIALFTCGKEGHRYVSGLSTLMMHEASGVSHGKIEEVEANAKEHRRVNDVLYKEMSINCGHSPDFFKKLAKEKSHADWFMTPTIAKKYNIANHIGNPTFKIDLKVTHQFGL